MSPRFGHNPPEPILADMVRLATIDDVPAMLEIAAERYPPFNRAEAEAWVVRIIEHPDAILLRSTHGFAAATLYATFWEPQVMKAAMLFVCVSRKANPLGFEGFRLIDAMRAWAGGRGASRLHLGTDTGVDLGPIAKRMKAKKTPPTYAVAC